MSHMCNTLQEIPIIPPFKLEPCGWSGFMSVVYWLDSNLRSLDQNINQVPREGSNVQ